MRSEYIAWPLKRHDICVMSDGAAVCLLASEKAAKKFCDNPTGSRALARERLHEIRGPPHVESALMPHGRKRL